VRARLRQKTSAVKIATRFMTSPPSEARRIYLSRFLLTRDFSCRESLEKALFRQFIGILPGIKPIEID
jgi:hypothetical protein